MPFLNMSMHIIKLDNKIRQKYCFCPVSLSRAPAISQCACAIDRREFRHGHFFGDPLRVDCEVLVEHVLCVCVEHTPGGVDVMVPVIPVGRGRHPVRGERERGSLWNDPEKNNDAVAILVQARQLALQIIIEMNEY